MKYDIDGHLWWAPTRKGSGWLLHKDSPSPPPPPDPTVTANAQTQSNQQTAGFNAGLNRVNQVTPFGDLTYTHTPQPGTFDQAGFDAATQKYNAAVAQGGDGSLTAPTQAQFTSAAGPDQWNSTITLSPAQQQILDQNNQLSTAMGKTAINQMGAVQNTLSSPMNFGSSPALVSHVGYGKIQNNLDTSNVPALVGGNQLATDLNTQRDSLYKQQSAYLDPQWAQQQHDLQNQLTQQGVMQNSDAWNRAMDDFNRQRTFAYNQAAQSAITGGGTEQSRLFGLGLASNQNAFGQDLQAGQFHNAAQAQGFNQGLANAQLQDSARQQSNNEIMQQRDQPLNELSSLRTGSQVTAPQFTGVPGSNMNGTDIAGLMGQNFNNQMGGFNSQVSQNNAINSGLMSLAAAAVMA